MGGGQLVQPVLAVGGEADAGEAAVAAVAPPFDQPAGFGAVDQLDRAVRPQQQVAGQVADGRAGLPAVALDGQQQLMLGRVRPTARAWAWDQCWKRPRPVRKASRFW